MLYSKHLQNFVFVIAVSFFSFFASPLHSYSQTDPAETDMVLILKGNTRLASGKAAEGVDLELKKNGQTVTKIMSGKNGKYSLQLQVSILNKTNDYLLYISQPGTVPKSISINAYITPEEYSAYTFPRYVFDLEIKIIETTIKDIVVQAPSGRIAWNYKEHAFSFDQTFLKTREREDDTARLLAEQKKKEEEEKAKEAARLKAETDARLLAEERSKKDAEDIVKKNIAAMQEVMRNERMQDSLDSLATAAAAAKKEPEQTINVSKPVSPDDVDENAFDGTGAYSINIAKRSLKDNQLKMSREKAANLSAKYETNNILTSLLNMVDEYDKSQKSLVKSTKQ